MARKGFIKNRDHFINYLNKVVDNTNVPIDQLCSREFYIEQIYNKHLENKYTWAVKDNPMLLTRNRVIAWLRKPNKDFIQRRQWNHLMTEQFKEIIEDLEGLPGVYGFWTGGRIPLYIGRSQNLGNRIPNSLERCQALEESLYFDYIRTKTVADTFLLEMYYIVELNPVLNKKGRTEDGFSSEITLNDPPQFSNWMQCSTITAPEIIKTHGGENG